MGPKPILGNTVNGQQLNYRRGLLFLHKAPCKTAENLVSWQKLQRKILPNGKRTYRNNYKTCPLSLRKKTNEGGVKAIKGGSRLLAANLFVFQTRS